MPNGKCDSFSFTSRVCQHRRFPRLAKGLMPFILKYAPLRFPRLVDIRLYALSQAL
ncbi:endo/excinuclease amino domain protein [Lactobacillus delbrueckii subsp. lactis DSM 20072]|nr:endo/excinuclease amino domain protein [Lactobacillus delbrueckii subsp. lactis DSM 20072]